MIPAPEEPSSPRLPVRAATFVPIQPIDPAALDQISDALHLRRFKVHRRSPILRMRHSYEARRRQLSEWQKSPSVLCWVLPMPIAMSVD